MGEFDRPEWVLSEEELRDELRNAREIDWPAEALKHLNYRHKWMITTPDEYDEYMQGLLKDGRNFPKIPLRYMDAPPDWRDKPFDVILDQIQSSPEEYQGYIMNMVNRYLTACEKRLGGKWPASKWDGSGNPWTTVNCYTFCCPEWVQDSDLLKKIIVLQKLQELIEGRMRQSESVGQIEEPMADWDEIEPVKWRGEQVKLEEFADQLQEQGYITSSKWFVDRFGSACPPEVNEWEGAANLLVYLLERLQARKMFTHVSQSRLESVFRIKAYKSKKDGYGRNASGKPTGANEIDRIFFDVFPDS
ncbi:MAG: hypothetical protein HGA87_05545 [Desulfobulbaceae bacterium]|nr:hypothetical protein [Desulfobulbaceae bacterium]